jgi:hypothetical protein
VKAILNRYSRETCLTRKPWKKEVRDLDPRLRIPIRALTISKSRLYNREPEIRRLLGSSATYFVHLKRHHREYAKARKRVDVCDYCLSYDRKYRFEVERAVHRHRVRLLELVPDYYESFDAWWQAASDNKTADVDGIASLSYVEELKQHINKQRRDFCKLSRAPKAHRPEWMLEQKGVAVVNKAQDEALREIDVILSRLRGYEHHWQSLRRQHRAAEDAFAEPGLGRLLVQLDFKENNSFPCGPEEGGDWFWATAREGVSTLGFFVTYVDAAGDLVEEYYLYVSQYLDHTSVYACVVLDDLLSRLPMELFSELHLWADCGPHFRSYEFAGHLLTVVHRRHALKATQLNFFVEKHGKGRCDGSFGLMEKWLTDYCHEHDIEDFLTFIAALQEGARCTMDKDPPPKGPKYTAIAFDPPPKPKLVVELDCDEVKVESTYCLRAVASGRPVGKVELHCGDITLQDWMFSDRVGRCAMPEKLSTYQRTKERAVKDLPWRKSYRKTQPEKAKPKHETLQRRLVAQQQFKEGGRAHRHEGVVGKLVTEALRLARQRAKMKRIRQGMKPTGQSDE